MRLLCICVHAEINQVKNGAIHRVNLASGSFGCKLHSLKEENSLNCERFIFFADIHNLAITKKKKKLADFKIDSLYWQLCFDSLKDRLMKASIIICKRYPVILRMIIIRIQ